MNSALVLAEHLLHQVIGALFKCKRHPQKWPDAAK